MPPCWLKVRLFFTFFCVLFIFSDARAEQEGLSSLALSIGILVEPMGLAFGVVGASVEHEFFPQIRVGLGFNYFDSDQQTIGTSYTEYRLNFAYYFREPIYNSFFAQVQTALDHGSTQIFRTRTNRNVTNILMVYSFMGGYAWNFDERWTVRLGAGVAIAPTTPDNQVQPILLWQAGVYL